MSLPVKSMRPSAEKAKNEPGADLYLASVGTTNATSIETYLTILGSVITRAKKPLLKLSPSEVRQLGAEMKTTKSGHQYLRELKKFYRANKRKNLEEAVPKTRQSNVSTVGPDDILTVEELGAMLEVAQSKRDRVLAVALYETGGRIAEVLSLNVEGLTRHENGGNDGRPWYKAWFSDVKNPGEQHFGYIKERASVAILDAFLRSYPKEITVRPRPLLPSFSIIRGDGRLTPTGANEILKTMARRAGITKRMHAHVFRHTRATHLLRAGTSEGVVKKLLGWSPSSKMLARYAHLVNEDVERDLGLSGEIGKPAEILLPQREVPAMTDLPFRTNPAKAFEMMREEILKEARAQADAIWIEEMKKVRDEVANQKNFEVRTATLEDGAVVQVLVPKKS
jgi:site-specific recombinase XerD